MTSEPSTDTPKRGGVAAGIAIAAHVLVLLLAFLAARVVSPSPGGGMEDVAAAAVTFLGGEAVVGLAAVIASMVLFRRGARYTGLGILGGWLGGLALLVLYQAIR